MCATSSHKAVISKIWIHKYLWRLNKQEWHNWVKKKPSWVKGLKKCPELSWCRHSSLKFQPQTNLTHLLFSLAMGNSKPCRVSNITWKAVALKASIQMFCFSTAAFSGNLYIRVHAAYVSALFCDSIFCAANFCNF